MFLYKGESYCPNYKCKDCTHLKRSGAEVTCPNFDHSKIEHYAPYFCSSKEETGFPCKFFKPSKIHVWDLENYWKDYKTWLEEWYETWGYDAHIYKEKEDKYVVHFMIKGDNDNRYAVPFNFYRNGEAITGNKLNAVAKEYYKKTGQYAGYKMVRERIEGVEL